MHYGNVFWIFSEDHIRFLSFFFYLWREWEECSCEFPGLSKRGSRHLTHCGLSRFQQAQPCLPFPAWFSVVTFLFLNSKNRKNQEGTGTVWHSLLGKWGNLPGGPAFPSTFYMTLFWRKVYIFDGVMSDFEGVIVCCKYLELRRRTFCFQGGECGMRWIFRIVTTASARDSCSLEVAGTLQTMHLVNQQEKGLFHFYVALSSAWKNLVSLDLYYELVECYLLEFQ